MPGEETGLRLRTMGVGSMVMITMAGLLDDIVQLTYPHQEKFSLQDLYPPAGEERDSGERTMGVGLEMSAPKKLSLQDLYPPRPARNGTPTKGRWGWG
jgi:hypothetical protein